LHVAVKSKPPICSTNVLQIGGLDFKQRYLYRSLDLDCVLYE